MELAKSAQEIPGVMVLCTPVHHAQKVSEAPIVSLVMWQMVAAPDVHKDGVLTMPQELARSAQERGVLEALHANHVPTDLVHLHAKCAQILMAFAPNARPATELTSQPEHALSALRNGVLVPLNADHALRVLDLLTAPLAPQPMVCAHNATKDLVWPHHSEPVPTALLMELGVMEQINAKHAQLAPEEQTA